MIPAAASANCAARTATRYASGCDIDSSHRRETGPRTPEGTKAPGQPCTAVEAEAFCTVTNVQHRW